MLSRGLRGAGSRSLTAIICLVVGASSAGGAEMNASAAQPKGAPIPPSPEFTNPEILPTRRDWFSARPIARRLKLKQTDPLLRPPFAGAPVDSLKGMAAGIRAVELDAPNRVRAARYLGTVDCVTYPQAQEMLILAMQEDPSEEVRYEAVLALRLMLSRCQDLAGNPNCSCESCCQKRQLAAENQQYEKLVKKEICKPPKKDPQNLLRRPRPAGPECAKGDPEQLRYDCCRGCCNADVLNALAKVAYGHDGQCYDEPSARVREAAACALLICPTYAPTVAPTPAAPPTHTPGGGEIQPRPRGEVVPEPVPPLEEAPEPNSAGAPLRPVPAAPPAMVQHATTVDPSQNPVIAGLKGYCVVALKSRQFVLADPRFSSVFEDRTYYFSSAEAKAAFDADPEVYAPAYGGVDPVEWLKTRQMVSGQFLREYDGRFYMFSSKENWEIFKSQPNRYVLNHSSNVYQVGAR